LLSGQKQTFICGCPAIIDLPDRAVVLAGSGVLEREEPAALLIRYRGASGPGAHRKRHPLPIVCAVAGSITNTRYVDGCIDILAGEHVDRTVSDIVGAQQPIVPKLSLHTQIPLILIRRVEVAQR